MQDLDLLFRIAGGAIFLITGLLVLRDASRRRDGVLFCVLTIGVTAYLIGNAKDPGFIVPPELAGPRQFLSGNLTFVYWWFCRSLFEDDFRLGPFEWAVAGLWVSVFLANSLWSGAPFGLIWVLIGLGLLLIAHVSWLLIADRGGDLVPARRKARFAFAAIPTAFILLDMGIDLAFGFGWKPLWFTVWQNGALLTVAGAMAYWTLQAEGTVFAEKTMSVPAVTPAPPKTEDERLSARVQQIMEEEEPYLDPALKFEAFAKQVGVGQSGLRKHINQELGHRHFRNFLNTWRIEAAKKMLSDPKRSKDKITTIAFDSGFASLASFNRAFSAHQHQSPSAYRAEVTRKEA